MQLYSALVMGRGSELLGSFMARIGTMMLSVHAFISILSGWSLL